MSTGPAMPILNGPSRNLSPLEEDKVKSNISRAQKLSSSELTHTKSKTPLLQLDSSDIGALVKDIGLSILTARSCDPEPSRIFTETELMSESNRPRITPRPSSLQENELLHAVNEETLPILISDLEHLWNQGLPLCIEVRGQAKGVCSLDDTPTLLLEQWSIQLLSKRTPLGSSAAPHLLLQALRSYLHFSQIRSWQERNGDDHSHYPFSLFYRVCAPGENANGFTSYSSVQHTFPSLQVSPHSALFVGVVSLPRLSHIPHELLPPSLRHHSLHNTALSGKLQDQSSRGQSSKPQGQSSRGQSSKSQGRSPKGQQISSETRNVIRRDGNMSPSPVWLPRDISKDGFPFSPPLPSPLSPKLLVGLADKLNFNSSSETTKLNCDLSSDGTRVNFDPSPEASCSCDKSVELLEKELNEFSLNSNNSSTRPIAMASSSSNRGGIVPPSASSPAPFSHMRVGGKNTGVKRRSCAIICKRAPSRSLPKRCNSAPVFVPSLCLLGTFEESVLNGRLELCGHVEGFTAEVGASGSFCPPHLLLPVTAAFYDLHDNHGGTSPYLGQVDLSGVGKRGYHVPRKGTVQVTLFNPNHTVVKIYVVRYDFSDMPPLSQTFLRQKTLSHPVHPLGHGTTPTTYFPALHYLIHLRFLCSKSKRIYLHRDIRLIFACRAPDIDQEEGKVSLYTTTEGPEEPKYSPCTATCSKHS